MKKALFCKQSAILAVLLALGISLCGCGDGNKLTEMEKKAIAPVVDTLNRQHGVLTLVDDVLIVYGTNDKKEEITYVFVEYKGKADNGHSGGSVAMYSDETYLADYEGEKQSTLNLMDYANSNFFEEYVRIRAASSCYTFYLMGQLSTRETFLKNTVIVEKEKVADYIEKKHGRTVRIED